MIWSLRDSRDNNQIRAGVEDALLSGKGPVGNVPLPSSSAVQDHAREVPAMRSWPEWIRRLCSRVARTTQLSKGAAHATAAGVATHRHLGSKLSRLSGRLLSGGALVRIQPIPRRSITIDLGGPRCSSVARALASGARGRWCDSTHLDCLDLM